MSDSTSFSPHFESTVDFDLEPDSATLHAFKNEPGETHRIHITQKKLGDCNVTGKLLKVHYGTFDGRPAVLIIFKFTFDYKGRSSSIFRYKEAKIRIIFGSEKGTQNVHTGIIREPVVPFIFPGRIYGYSTPEHIRWQYELGASLGLGPALPAQFGVQPKGTRERQIDRKHCMTIQGHCEFDEAHREVAIWTLEENQADPKGIPRELICAAVVEHHDVRFRAEVEVKVKTGLAAGIVDPRYWRMWAKVWDQDDPVIFEPAIAPDSLILKGAEGLDLSTLTEEQCRGLAPLPEEYQAIFPFG